MIGEFPRAGAPPVGGVQTSTERLTRALAERGVSVTIIAPETGVPGANGTGSGGSGESPAVVRVWAGDRLLLPQALRPWRKRVRATLAGLDADVVHGQGLVVGGLAAADASGLPRIVSAHGDARADLAWADRGAAGRVRGELRHRLARSVVERADAVVGVHPQWRWNVPVEPRRFVHIPNIVDEEFFRGRSAPAAPVVLFCGGSRPIKGWSLLASAWPEISSAVPEARLDLVGWEGATPPPGLAADGAEVSARGWLPAAELAAAMASASVLVICSRYEVAPVALAEAWAAGLPVVATRVGGISDLAQDAAVLVAPNSPSALAAAVVRVLEGDVDVATLTEEGSRRARAQRAGAVAAAHAALYSELI